VDSRPPVEPSGRQRAGPYGELPCPLSLFLPLLRRRHRLPAPGDDTPSPSTARGPRASCSPVAERGGAWYRGELPPREWRHGATRSFPIDDGGARAPTVSSPALSPSSYPFCVGTWRCGGGGRGGGRRRGVGGLVPRFFYIFRKFFAECRFSTRQSVCRVLDKKHSVKTALPSLCSSSAVCRV